MPGHWEKPFIQIVGFGGVPFHAEGCDRVGIIKLCLDAKPGSGESEPRRWVEDELDKQNVGRTHVVGRNHSRSQSAIRGA